MRSAEYNDFDTVNRETILKFINQSVEHNDDISGSALATIAQFIMNLRLNIGKKGHARGWVTPDEIIDSQIEELRRCIVDLQAYKERLIEGVTKQ